MHRALIIFALVAALAVAIAGGDAHLGAGMLAIYSPQQGWIGNVLNAARALREGKGIGGPGSGIFATAAQRDAADRLILRESAPRRNRISDLQKFNLTLF